MEAALGTVRVCYDPLLHTMHHTDSVLITSREGRSGEQGGLRRRKRNKARKRV
jgi:hypothetical protein